MKKVLFILAFLAIGMIATAQTQTIYNQLKLATVNDGTASDSLVLVQGTDKIIRKIPLSSISGSTEIPSLQEVTNNGNVTSHPIYAKEFRVESNADSLMVLNNRYFSIGDFGNDYNGSWNRTFALFDPQNYSDGFSMFSYNDAQTKQIDVTAYAGFVRLNPWYDTDNQVHSNLVMQDNIFYQGSGNKIGTLISNHRSDFGEVQLGVIENNLVFQSYDGMAPDYTNWLRIHPSESRIYLDADKFVLNGTAQLATSNVDTTETFEFPSVSGELLIQERDFAPYGNYSFGGQYGSYSEDLRRFGFETAGNGVDGFNGVYSIEVNPEEANLRWRNASNSTQAAIGVSQADIYLSTSNDIIGSSSYNLAADKATYGFNSTSVGFDTYSFIPASKTSGSESANYYMPISNGHIAIIGQTAPASATASGVVGEVRVTATYIYVCIADNTWVRTALATW